MYIDPMQKVRRLLSLDSKYFYSPLTIVDLGTLLSTVHRRKKLAIIYYSLSFIFGIGFLGVCFQLFMNQDQFFSSRLPLYIGALATFFVSIILCILGYGNIRDNEAIRLCSLPMSSRQRIIFNRKIKLREESNRHSVPPNDLAKRNTVDSWFHAIAKMNRTPLRSEIDLIMMLERTIK